MIAAGLRDLDAEATMLAEMVDGVARDVIAPRAAAIDLEGVIFDDVLEALAGQGLLGAGVPELADEDVDARYGLLVTARLARVSGSVAAATAAVHEASAAFGERERLHGRPPRWMPALVPGGVRAQPLGAGLELSGEYPRVELDLEHGALVVLASQDGGDELVVELDASSDGVELGPRERTSGLRGRSVHAVRFDGARVGSGDVVGRAADAARARTTRQLTTAALGLGIAQGALEAATTYAAERRQFGGALSTFPAVRGHLLEMEQQVETVSALLWGAARASSERPAEPRAALHAARAGLEAAGRVPRLAVQVLGGYGYMEEYPVEVRLRDGISTVARAEGVEALNRAAAHLAEGKGAP